MSDEEKEGRELLDATVGRPRARTALAIAIVGATELLRAQIIGGLAEMAEPLVEIVDAGQPANGRHKRIAIVVLNADRETWALQIQEIKQDISCAGVIAAIADGSAEGVRHALRAGANDVIFLPATAVDLSRSLIRLCEASDGPARHQGEIYALASVSGGVGVTTLAAMLAFALKRLTGKRIALIDLAAQTGALAALLDITPEHTLADLIDPTVALDSIRLESSLTAHHSGIYLLAAPHRIEQSEMITADTIVPVLEIMRELFDYVLVDCGHHMNEGLVACWELAHRLIYPVEQGVTSVRPAQRFLEMFRRLQLKDVELQLLLNKYDSSNPFSAEKIEAVLAHPIAARLPRDDETFLQLQLNAQDLAGSTSPRSARAAIETYARTLCGVAQQQDGGWLRRWRNGWINRPAVSEDRGLSGSIAASTATLHV